MSGSGVLPLIARSNLEQNIHEGIHTVTWIRKSRKTRTPGPVRLASMRETIGA